jgi:hypothetical protein
MDHLGIDVAECREEDCETAGGVIKQHIWPKGIDVEIQQLRRRVTLKAAFSAGLPPQVVLLGRKDFFAEFRVEFDERAQTFSLDPYESPAS